MKFSFTADQLRNNHSGTYMRELRKAEYEPYPVTKFGNTEYVLLAVPHLRPGRQTANVINLTEFNTDPTMFKIIVDGQGYAFLIVDEGISALVEYTPEPGRSEITDYVIRHTAVLTYRVEPATRADLEQTEDELEAEMENGLGFSAPIM